MQNILLTGSEGLIGNLLSSRLTEYNIISLDQIVSNAPNYARTNLQSIEELKDKLAEYHPIDCILHLAGHCDPNAGWNSILVNNIIATRTIFEFAKDRRVGKFIFASSNHVTGLYEGRPPSLHLQPDTNSMVSIEMPLRPDSYYGVSKAFGEALGRYFSEAFKIKTICLRLGSVLKDDNPGRNARHRSTWLSHNDLVLLFEGAMKSKVDYGIYYGVSNNSKRFWDLTNAQNELNYHPQDNAENFYNAAGNK